MNANAKGGVRSARAGRVGFHEALALVGPLPQQNAQSRYEQTFARQLAVERELVERRAELAKTPPFSAWIRGRRVPSDVFAARVARVNALKIERQELFFEIAKLEAEVRREDIAETNRALAVFRRAAGEVLTASHLAAVLERAERLDDAELSEDTKP